MRLRLVAGIACALAGLAALGAGTPATPRTASPLAPEIARLRAVLDAAPQSDEVKETAPGLRDALDRAAAHERAGRFLAAVDTLEYARSTILALDTMARQTPADGGDLDRFTAAWQAAGPGLEKDARTWAGQSWAGVPAAVRAVAESAFGRSQHLYQAADSYARVTSPAAGYYYMGEAQGTMTSALFVRGLGAPRSGAAAPAARSLKGERTSLAKRIEAIYKPPLAIDRHPDFIRTNSALKLAGELDDAGLRYGALLAYLKAERGLGELLLPVPQAGERGAIEARLKEAHERHATAQRDDSIALVLIEAAQGGIESARDDAARGTALRTASAVLDQALPAYRATLEDSVPEKLTAATAAPAVRVTLVRWPYT